MIFQVVKDTILLLCFLAVLYLMLHIAANYEPLLIEWLAYYN